MRGSVYQRSSDFRWVAALNVRGRKVVRYAGSEQEAWYLLGRLSAEVESGSPAISGDLSARSTAPATGTVTLAGWTRTWLADGDWRPTTRATYSRCLETWCAELGDVKLGTLSPALLYRTLSQWRQDGVGARTLQQRWQYLHGCLAQAVQLQVIDQNPLDHVPRPKARSVQRTRWSVEEARRFLAICRNSTRFHADLLAFLVLTGLRISEALALEWWDLTDQRIQIEKALVWSEGSWTIECPKSDAGRRTIALHPDARQILDTRQRTYDRIFVTSSGTPPRRDNMTRLMKALCAEAGVPRIRVHDLRHVHAALLVAGGLDIKSLQASLGHSKAAMSLDVYAYASTAPDRTVDALLQGLDQTS